MRAIANGKRFTLLMSMNHDKVVNYQLGMSPDKTEHNMSGTQHNANVGKDPCFAGSFVFPIFC